MHSGRGSADGYRIVAECPGSSSLAGRVVEDGGRNVRDTRVRDGNTHAKTRKSGAELALVANVRVPWLPGGEAERERAGAGEAEGDGAVGAAPCYRSRQRRQCSGKETARCY
jgi:hypothetical protein